MIMFIMLYCLNPYILGEDTPCLTLVGVEMCYITIIVLSILVFGKMPLLTQKWVFLNHSKS